MSLPIDPISSQQTLLGLVVFIRVFWPNRGFCYLSAMLTAVAREDLVNLALPCCFASEYKEQRP